MKTYIQIIFLLVIYYKSDDIEDEIDWDKIETVNYQQKPNTNNQKQKNENDEVMQEFLNEEYQQNNLEKSKGQQPADQQDIEALEQQLDMLQQFSCYMAVQKKLKDHEEDIKAMSKNMKAKTSFQKVVANLYKLCIENISPEKQKEVIQTNNPEEFQKLNFDFYEQYNINEVMSDPDSNMTENEAEFYKRYEKLEEEMAKLKQEAKERIEQGNNKKENKDNKKSNQKETSYITPTDQLNILGITFQKVNPFFVVIPILFIIALIFKAMWNGLFKEQQIRNKKKSKKKQK